MYSEELSNLLAQGSGISASSRNCINKDTSLHRKPHLEKAHCNDAITIH